MITFTIPATIVLMLVAFLFGAIVGGYIVMMKAEGR
jgi:uncharacterized protein YneF (UPF0154 family)